MNDIDTYLTQIKNLIEIWDNESPRSIEVAKDLNLNLTFLKVLIGINNFDNLDAFCRYLKDTTKYINDLENKGKTNENS